MTIWRCNKHGGRFVYRFIISRQRAFYWKAVSRIIEVGSITWWSNCYGVHFVILEKHSKVCEWLSITHNQSTPWTFWWKTVAGIHCFFHWICQSLVIHLQPQKNWCAVEQNKTALESTENLLQFRTGRMPSVKSPSFPVSCNQTSTIHQVNALNQKKNVISMTFLLPSSIHLQGFHDAPWSSWLRIPHISWKSSSIVYEKFHFRVFDWSPSKKNGWINITLRLSTPSISTHLNPSASWFVGSFALSFVGHSSFASPHKVMEGASHSGGVFARAPKNRRPRRFKTRENGGQIIRSFFVKETRVVAFIICC